MFKHTAKETLNYTYLYSTTVINGSLFRSSLFLYTGHWNSCSITEAQSTWDDLDLALLSYIGWL